MATRAGVAWVEVLPSMGGFAAAVTAQSRVPLAAAGRTAGTEYGNGLVGAVRQSLGSLTGVVGKQTGAAAASAAKSVEAAESKVSAARRKAQDAAGKLRVEELKLAELRSKDNATASQIAAAEGRVAKAKSLSAKADGDAMLAGKRLSAVRNGSIRESTAEIAAAEKLALARQREVAASTSVNVAAAKLADLRAKGGASASQIAAAEEKLAAAQRNASAASGVASKAAAELSAAEKKAGDSAAVAQGKFARFRGAVDSGAGAMTGKLVGFGKAAAGMAGMFGAFEAVHFAGESLKAAEEFQKGANVLVTAAGESQSNLAMIQKGLLDISSKTGTSTEQMTEGMYTVEKAGYRAKDGLAVMDAAAKGARDEGADLHTVTNALTTVLSNQGMKAQDSAKAMNAIMVAAGHSKVSLQDFSGSLSNVLAIGKGAGISLADISGAMSVMTAKGMSAQAATDTLKSTIQGLIKPNTAMANAMMAFGISSQDVSSKLGERGLQGTMKFLSDTVKHQLGPGVEKAEKILTTMPEKLQGLYAGVQNGTATLGQFYKAVDKTKGATDDQKDSWKSAIPMAMNYNTAMARITGRTTGLQTALMLTSDANHQYAKTHDEVQHALSSTEHFEQKWHQTTKTAAAQLAIAKQTIHNVGVELALKLMPAVAMAAKGFTWLVTGATSIAKANWGWIKWVGAGILGVVAAVKAVNLAMLVWNATTKAAELAQLLWIAATRGATIAQKEQILATRTGAILVKGWIAIQRAAAAAQWVWNAAMEGNPIVLVITGLVALGAAMVVAYKKSETFRNIVQGAWNGIKAAASAVVGWFTGTAWPLLHKGLDEVGAAATWLWKNAFQPAMQGIGNAGKWMWDNALKPAFAALSAAGKAIWDHGLKPAFSALSTAIDFVGKHWKVFATILAIPLTPIIVPLVGVFKLLQTYGMTALRAVGGAAMWLWNTALGPAFRAAGALGLWLWNAALKPALGGIETGARKTGGVAMWLWSAAVGPAFRAIGALGSWLWNTALKPALNGIWGGMQTLAKGVQWVWQNGFSVAFRAIGSLGMWLWHYVIGPMAVASTVLLIGLGKAAMAMWNSWFKPAFGWIGDKASWLWHHAIAPMASAVVGLLKDIGKWASWLWTSGIKPTFQWIGDKATWLWNKAIKPAASGIVGGFKDVAKWAKWLWDNGIKPTFQWIGDKATWLWNKAIKPMIDREVEGFKNLAKWAKWLWDKGIKPAFDGIAHTIQWVYDHTIHPVFNKIGDIMGRDDTHGLRGTVRNGVTAITKIWNGLQDAFKKPINGVIDFTTKYFVHPFNKIASTVHVSQIPDLQKLASGGPVPGQYVHDRADNTLAVSDAGVPIARVNPGEFITRNASVRSMESRHPGALDYINTHGRLPGYADGGKVGELYGHLPGYWPGGGIVDSIKHGVSSAWNGAKHVASSVAHAVTHPEETAKKAASTAKDVVTGTLSGDALKLARVVKFALQQVGKPYVWGAEGPGSFDCSGLVKAAYASGAGMSMDHFADTQLHMGRAVSRSHLQPGDLLGTIGGHPIPHVAMAITPDLMVQAANPRVGVIGPSPIPASLPAGARRLLGDVNSTEVSGIVKGLGAIDFVKGAVSAGMGELARSMLEPLRSVLKKPIDGLASKFGKNNFVVDMASGEAKHIVDGSIDWAEHLADSILGSSDSGGSPTNYSPTGGVARWKETIQQALTMNGIAATPDMIARWERQIATESSGNPNAVQGNIGDINNKTGDLAKGLVQVIGSTFRAYHFPGTANNVFDPLANLAAGINYAKHRYGPSMSYIGNGHGYAGGTPYAAPGVAEVAENGAEIVFGRQWRRFKGGEQVYNRSQLASLSKAHKADAGAGQIVTPDDIIAAFASVRFEADGQQIFRLVDKRSQHRSSLASSEVLT